MALPLIAASMGGIIITSLTTFFATRIPVILAAIGLSATVYTGLDIIVDQVISGVQGTITGGTVTFGGQSINGLGILGAAGLWDAANIMLSGYVSVAAIKMAKVAVTALAKP